jgi:hypothetical protein
MSFKKTTIKKIILKLSQQWRSKKIFNNVNNHILNELGFELQKKTV